MLARTGQRVRLEHVRVGGKLYTTPGWIDEFGRRLAEADAAYFDHDEQTPAPESAQSRPTPKRSSRASRSSGCDEARRRHLEAECELDAEGL